MIEIICCIAVACWTFAVTLLLLTNRAKIKLLKEQQGIDRGYIDRYYEIFTNRQTSPGRLLDDIQKLKKSLKAHELKDAELRNAIALAMCGGIKQKEMNKEGKPKWSCSLSYTKQKGGE